MRLTACELLREIGSKRSLEDLSKTKSDRSPAVCMRGEQAIAAIEDARDSIQPAQK